MTNAENSKTYRALVESLCAAIREEIIETGSTDDVPASAQARYDAMLRALDKGVEEAAFRVHTISFVRLVEYAFRAHRGCPVLLRGLLGEVYTQSVEALAQEGRYPVIRRRFASVQKCRKTYADYLMTSAQTDPPQHRTEDPQVKRVSPHIAWRNRAVERVADRYAGFDLAYFRGVRQ